MSPDWLELYNPANYGQGGSSVKKIPCKFGRGYESSGFPPLLSQG